MEDIRKSYSPVYVSRGVWGSGSYTGLNCNRFPWF